MNRVVQIENQTEEINQVSSYEAEQLIRKYQELFGDVTPNTQYDNVQDDLTFEEIIMREERKRNEERKRAEDKRNEDHSIRYATDDDTGFSFKIDIKSDMKIP